MHAWKIVILLAYLIAVVLSMTVSKQVDKRQAKNPGNVSFKTMMRYGRGGNPMKFINVYPRAESFFLGPRYGKRSASWNTDVKPPFYSPSTLLCAGTDLEDLSCTYTGIADLYRCNQRKDNGEEDLTTETE